MERSDHACRRAKKGRPAPNRGAGPNFKTAIFVLASYLEIQTQGELNLTIGPGAYAGAQGLVKFAERSAISGGGRCEGLSRLEGRAESRRGDRARWIREVRMVENVVELGAKFHVNGFMDWESFLHGQVRLPIARAVDQA